MNLTSLTLTETLTLLTNKKTSESELTKAYSDRIKALDPKIESYLCVNEEILRSAQNDSLGVLAGIPVGHKDVFCTADLPTTVGSKILDGYRPPFDATVVAKLKQAGAVTLGKLNTDEFVMGSSGETSAYQTTKNPWDLTRVPGGSSAGSAAAVAADLCVFATASDTGGSIRQPAAFCGVTGLKPTYGRIGRYGAIAMASSLDTVGLMTKTAEDAAIVLKELAGNDPKDATSGTAKVPDYPAALKTGLKGVKIGIPKEYFIAGLDPEVEKSIQTAIAELKKLGAEVKEVSLPHTEYAVPAYYVIASSEISANLARFDGIRYGVAAKEAQNLVESYFEARTKGFGDEVKRRIMLGTFALSAGYADAFYKKALRVRTLIKQDFDAAFREVDLLATPVTPTTAFKLGEKKDNPLEMYLGDIFTIPASLAGVPGISIPCGFDTKKLPIGLQLFAPQWQESRLLAAAHTYQTATDWHMQKPTL